MNCDAFPSRLTTIKQTYGRQNKNKNVGAVSRQTSLDSYQSPKLSKSAQLIPVVPCTSVPQHLVNNTPKACVSPPHLASPSRSDSPVTSPVLKSPQNKSENAVRLKPHQNSVGSASCWSSPQNKSANLAPNIPRTIPTILKRVSSDANKTKSNTPSSQKHVSPKKEKVSGSPKNSPKKIYKFHNFSPPARILTSYVKLGTNDHQNQYSCTKDVGVQCELQQTSAPVSNSTPKPSNSTPKPSNSVSHHKSKPGKIVCDVEHKTDDMIIVKHFVDGHVYTGILMKDSVSVNEPNYGFFAEQLPSQHNKKIKSKLGLSFENVCDSENSDSESAKIRLKKMKNSELKTMRDGIAGSSPSEKVTKKQMPVVRAEDVPKARPNVPYKNMSNHNKSSINGMANFLKEASADKSVFAQKLIKTEPDCYPCHKKPKTEDNSAVYVAYVKKESTKTSKKSVCKFGEKFQNKLLPSSSITISSEKAGPSWIFNDKASSLLGQQCSKNRNTTSSSEGPARNYKMRSKTNSGTDNKFPIQQLIRQTSGSLGYIDLEWPSWCPRKVELVIPRTTAGKPGRYKLEHNGSKRRRRSSESSVSSYMEDLDQKYTEGNNPFGVGDVVIAKRMSAPGRPYWPGKVLSTTGLTVCVSFYNTVETMQIPKCNVEWYYDGCIAHKIKHNPIGDSKFVCLEDVKKKTDSLTTNNRQTRAQTLDQDWKQALNSAESDIKSSIGVRSVVWGKYDEEWWPARVLQIDHRKKCTVMWLDNESIEPLPLSDLSPFLLSYHLRYEEELVEEYENYRRVVDQAHHQALLLLLETKSHLEEAEST